MIRELITWIVLDSTTTPAGLSADSRRAVNGRKSHSLASDITITPEARFVFAESGMM